MVSVGLDSLSIDFQLVISVRAVYSQLTFSLPSVNPPPGSLPAHPDSFPDSFQIFFCDFTGDDLNNIEKKNRWRLLLFFASKWYNSNRKFKEKR